MSRVFQVTFDAHDPERLGAFWAFALGYVPDAPPRGFATWAEFLAHVDVPEDLWNSAFGLHDPQGTGPRLFFQQVPEDKVVKNRVHLDLRAAEGLTGEERMAALEQRAAALVAAGATRLHRQEPDGRLSAGWIVMADPEGNEFCLD